MIRPRPWVNTSARSSTARKRLADSRDGRRILKVVSFFLFDYRSGDVADHDHEVEEARWIPLERARKELSHRGERDMVDRALSRLAADR